MAKDCGCKPASASGPRPVTLKLQEDDGSVRVVVTVVRFACDHCDRPWVAME